MKNIPELSLSVLAAFTLTCATASAATIFTESFETTVVTGNTSTDPTGWSAAGHPGYQGLKNVDGLHFTTPFGSQGLNMYTTTGESGWANVTTTSSILSAVLTADTGYTLSFNVADNPGRPRAAYRAELVAINDSGPTITVLDFVFANNDGSNDMSYSDSFTFTPDVTHNALLGQRIAIRLGMDYDYNIHGAAYQDQPIFDNVKLDAVAVAVPEPSAALLGGLGTLLLLRRRK